MTKYIRDTAEKGSVIFHELYLKLARGRDSLHFKTQIVFRKLSAPPKNLVKVTETRLKIPG